jgi:hypothetical protein
MAARPPDDSQSEPESIAFGIAALDARLDERGVQFPATSDEIVAALDDPSIPYDSGGNTLDLADALDRVSRDRFETERELLDALHPVFEERRTSTAGSVVGRLRGMLPF